MNKIMNKLILLMLSLLSINAYADCTKKERLKLIEGGYFKTEINSICNEKNNLKWISPSIINCKIHGGKFNEKGTCEASWAEAKNICRYAGGFLPSIDALRKEVTTCGGKISDNDYEAKEFYDENLKNSPYQDCYKKSGFVSDFYWSSTIDEEFKLFKAAWIINFYNGYDRPDDIRNSNGIRCIAVDQ